MNIYVSSQINSNPSCSTSINTVPTLAINCTPNDCESNPNLRFYIDELILLCYQIVQEINSSLSFSLLSVIHFEYCWCWTTFDWRPLC